MSNSPVSVASPDSLPLGATWHDDGGCDFLVWAPSHDRVEVHIVDPPERCVPMQPLERGYHHARTEGVPPGALYRYRLSGQAEWPDPASRSQPQGVHGPSQVLDPRFPWADAAWRGLALEDYVTYELHTGTFTPEGTFAAIVPRLDELKDLGVTAVELMPVAQFPGARNWGYDGVYPFAAQNTYGGATGLKTLVNACHRRGLAVVLDVVYNHLGPEGNYLGQYAPYFTDRYRTPWGEALNFDGAHSDDVRRYFIENALAWVTGFHIDALRLDAIHAIVDASACPFLQELGAAVHARAKELRRRIHVIPESDRNDSRIIRPREQGGCGLDAQWSDDFHHSLHTLLTGEREGYYADFGSLAHLARAFAEGYVYSGQYSIYRRRRHGNLSRDLPACQFVVCAQNHDQVGNRRLGDRLTTLVDFESLKLVGGVVLLSPYLPLLFMGEEYGEPAPFLYFTSHGDPGLIEAVRKGRREEFARFNWHGEVPDPQDESTFERSRIHWDLRNQGQHKAMREFYRELLALRRRIALARLDKAAMNVIPLEKKNTLAVYRCGKPADAFAVFHFGEKTQQVELPLPAGRWTRILDSAEERWHGPGSAVPAAIQSRGNAVLALAPRALVLFSRESLPAARAPRSQKLRTSSRKGKK